MYTVKSKRTKTDGWHFQVDFICVEFFCLLWMTITKKTSINFILYEPGDCVSIHNCSHLNLSRIYDFTILMNFKKKKEKKNMINYVHKNEHVGSNVGNDYCVLFWVVKYNLVRIYHFFFCTLLNMENLRYDYNDIYNLSLLLNTHVPIDVEKNKRLQFYCSYVSCDEVKTNFFFFFYFTYCRSQTHIFIRIATKYWSSGDHSLIMIHEIEKKNLFFLFVLPKIKTSACKWCRMTFCSGEFSFKILHTLHSNDKNKNSLCQ